MLSTSDGTLPLPNLRGPIQEHERRESDVDPHCDNERQVKRYQYDAEANDRHQEDKRAHRSPCKHSARGPARNLRLLVRQDAASLEFLTPRFWNLPTGVVETQGLRKPDPRLVSSCITRSLVTPRPRGHAKRLHYKPSRPHVRRRRHLGGSSGPRRRFPQPTADRLAAPLGTLRCGSAGSHCWPGPCRRANSYDNCLAYCHRHGRRLGRKQPTLRADEARLWESILTARFGSVRTDGAGRHLFSTDAGMSIGHRDFLQI